MRCIYNNIKFSLFNKDAAEQTLPYFTEGSSLVPFPTEINPDGFLILDAKADVSNRHYPIFDENGAIPLYVTLPPHVLFALKEAKVVAPLVTDSR